MSLKTVQQTHLQIMFLCLQYFRLLVVQLAFTSKLCIDKAVLSSFIFPLAWTQYRILFLMELEIIVTWKKVCLFYYSVQFNCKM